MKLSLRAVVLGAGTYAGMTTATYYYFKKDGQNVSTASSIAPPSEITEQVRSAAVSQVATCYDNEIGWDERFMGLNLLRWWMVRKAKGDVLEVSCGTGRNFEYYPSGCQSLTATDLNSDMLKVASTKVNSLQLKSEDEGLALKVANVEKLPFPDNSFDTVVDTFGICSYEDPVKALNEMARVCKPDGQVLLLEHGRGHYHWINNALDNSAPDHAQKWGCWWNRPIDQLLNESNLNVKSSSRFHFGTTWMLELQPNK